MKLGDRVAFVRAGRSYEGIVVEIGRFDGETLVAWIDVGFDGFGNVIEIVDLDEVELTVLPKA